jgi:DNA-binding NtrC family response regulator
MITNIIACIPDPRLRILFSLLLTDAGALVAACPNHEEALRVLANGVCQLCVFVNGANGDEGEFLAEEIRVSPETKFLLIANREEVDAVLPIFWR